jgi:tetratricopeptide (TPR) repeat protein
MSTETDRIKQLHEQASELYLNGDYQGAIHAWNEILALDPANDEALGGVRMAEQFVAPAEAAALAPAAAVAAPALEHELDEGLKVLDGTSMPELLPAEVNDGSVDRMPVPVSASAADEEVPEGWEMPSQPAAPEESYGLEPMARSGRAAGAPASAAAAELKRRVQDLLNEAKAKASAGERDEALAILARLGILDEENPEADALRAQIEAAGSSNLDKVENAIIEGVAALEADRLDEAEKLFREALALSPEHREALHYLEKIEERRTGGVEDLLGSVEGEAAPPESAVQKATGPEEAPPKLATPTKAKSAPQLPDLDDAPVAAAGPRFSLPATKILIGGAIAAIVLVGGAVTLPRLFKKSVPKFTAPAPAAAPRATKAARPAPKAAAAAPASNLTPAERAKAIESGLASARSKMAAGDAGAAVIAYNDVLALDPSNADAKAGITEAGDQYKATKAVRDSMNSVKLAFRDEEFSSALRLAYRMPLGVPQSYVDGVKVAGWYNMAVVALRAGDCRAAQQHLDEALQVNPSDQEAKSLRDLAAQYSEAVKDRAFFDRVEALSFRSPPAS